MVYSIKQFFFSIFAQNGSFVGLDLDLEHYVVPAPSSSVNSIVYTANMTENPRSPVVGRSTYSFREDDNPVDRPTTFKV